MQNPAPCAVSVVPSCANTAEPLLCEAFSCTFDGPAVRIQTDAGNRATLCACRHGFGPASPLDVVKGALTSEAVRAEAILMLPYLPPS